MLYHILSIGGVVAKAADRDRAWLALGRPTILVPGLFMQIFCDRVDGEHQVLLQLHVPTRAHRQELRVPPDHHADLSALCGLHIFPRALELRRSGYPRRVLIEFVRTSPTVQWARERC